MKSKKNKVRSLSIFLLKKSCQCTEDIVDQSGLENAVEISVPTHGKGYLYIKKNQPAPPKWADLFSDQIDVDPLKLPSLSAIFTIDVDGRWFALTFGQGGRFLLKDEVSEERFGLLCALNSVDPDTFRCVDVQSLDAIQSHKRIQSGQEAKQEQFGLDVEQDMLKAIVGTPKDSSLGVRMTGSDSLSVNVRVELKDLPSTLAKYAEKFEEDLSSTDHQWVNNISIVRNTALIEDLESELNANLAKKDLGNCWLAIPEIIDWSCVVGFMYTGGKKEIFPDVNLRGFLKTVRKETVITLDLLRQRKVLCADADHNQVYKKWSVFKCLYAEVDVKGQKYILNDGKWFCIAVDFVDKTNLDYSKLPMSKISLPPYVGGGEGSYNASVAQNFPDKFALLDDKKKVMHGGGHGQVEVCDLLSINRELIHVKIYGKSSVFSHLFSQGFVSGQLIQIDSEFRKKVKSKLAAPFNALLDVNEKPKQDEFTVVYAVISEEPGDGMHLPFFSRVNLNNTARVLRGYGYKVELLKIPVEESFSKTTKLPLKK